MKENIKEILDLLAKTTIWVFVSLLSVLIAFFSTKKTEVAIGDVKIESSIAGLFLFAILLGINLYILKLFQHLEAELKELRKLPATDPNKVDILVLLNKHNWVFNPFSKTSAKYKILDDLGYPFLFIIWWIGFSMALHLTLQQEKYWYISFSLAVLYLGSGILTVLSINSFINEISKNKYRKGLTIVAISIGFLVCLAINTSLF